MKCPKCGSSNTKKPAVTSPRWKVGTQVCLDCDFQGDWVLFIAANLSPEKLKALQQTEDDDPQQSFPWGKN